MGFWLTLGIWAATWIISYYLRKSAASDAPPNLVEKLPRIAEGEPVPFAFGRVKVDAPALLWIGFENVGTSTPHNVSAVVQFALATSNIRVDDPTTDAQARLCEYGIWINDTQPVQGSWRNWDTFVAGHTNVNPTVDPLWHPSNHDQRVHGITVHSVDVALGEPPNVSHARGVVEFSPGRWDCLQGVVLGNTLVNRGIDMAYQPPYRGTITMSMSLALSVLGQPAIVEGFGGFQFGIPAYPRVSAEFINPCAIRGFATAVGQGILEMTDGDCNPAAVLWTVLTQGWGGLPVPYTKLDYDAFAEIAATLFVEQNGMSGIVYRSESAESIIGRICDQTEMVLYEDPQTFLLTPFLVREDYDPEFLDEVDADDIDGSPELILATWNDTRNLIRVKFTNRAKAYNQDEVEAFDQANYEMTGAKRAETYDLPWVTNRTNAAKIASRILYSQALPLAKVKFTCKRSSIFWTPGKVFRYVHPTNSKLYIMRVARVDVGTGRTGGVVIDAVQDRWSFGYTIAVPPEVVVEYPPLPPLAPDAELVTETPRWIHVRASANNQLPGAALGSLLYLARPSGDETWYQGHLDVEGDGRDSLPDSRLSAFAGTAKVLTDYSREAEPFDTTEGLEITGLLNWTLLETDPAEIRQHAFNTILVGDDETAELMSFQSFTSLGGGNYRLEDVRRGQLDTVPRAHLAGETVYLLNTRSAVSNDAVVQRVGTSGVLLGSTVTGRILPTDPPVAPPLGDVEAHQVAVRVRPLLPFPVADLEADAAKTIPDVDEEGIDLTWLRRNRLNDLVILGTDPDEAPDETGVTYDVRAARAGDAGVVVAAALTGTGNTYTSAAIAGCGTISLSVRTKRTTTIGGETVVYESWQDPQITGYFHTWRNLLLNPRFGTTGSSTFTKWTTVSGTPTLGAGGAFGDGNHVVGASGDDPTEWRQRVSIIGFRPKRLGALLTFFTKGQSGDTDDTVEADLQSMTGAFANLQTATLAATTIPGRWDRRTLEIANLDASTEVLQARFEQRQSGDEPPGVPNASVADVDLCVGQFTSELLTNGSLAGATSWTVDAGSFSSNAAEHIDGGSSCLSGDGGTNTLHQDVSVPTGFHFGRAVLKVGARHVGGGFGPNTATVTLEARSSGGTVLASATSSFTPSLSWTRRALSCDVPLATSVVRVTLSSTTTDGVNNKTTWDAATLRIHKDLEPRVEVEVDLSDVQAQVIPHSPYTWSREYPDVPPPTYGMFLGDGTGGTGREPQIKIEDGVRLSSIYLPAGYPALEFREAEAAVVRARSDSSYANFTSSQSFTVRIVFTALEGSTSFGLCGRLGTTGWEICVIANEATVRLVGSTGTVTLGGFTVPYGGPTYVALIHDAAADTLRIVTPQGTSSTSTAGMGEIACAELIPFVIGDSTMTSPVTLTGTVASVDLWSSALAHATITSLWKWGVPTWAHSISEDPLAAGARLCVVGTDDVGNQVVGEFSHGVPWAEVDGQVGMPVSSGRTNMVNSNPCQGTWQNFGTPTVTLDAGVAPNGRHEVLRITTTNDTAHFRGVAAAMNDLLEFVHVSAMVRSPDAVLGYIRIYETDGTPASDEYAFALTEFWNRINQIEIAIYPGSDPSHVVFTVDGSGTLELGGPLWVDQSLVHYSIPIAIPQGAAGSAACYMSLDGLGLDEQSLHEGEIEVSAASYNPLLEEGTLARLHNGTDTDDAHRLYATVSTSLFSHRDGSGAEIISEISEDADWDEPRVLRGRWNRAGLLDAANAFAGIVTDGGAATPQDFDRTTVWTPGTVVHDVLEIGHAGGGSTPWNGLIRKVVVRAREKLLPATL
jgi:hypothetical protein